MAHTRPGRLYRTLSKLGIPAPLVSVVASGYGTINDNRIRSIVSHHGTAGPDDGINPSMCEIATTLLTPVLTRNNITVSLLPAAAARIAALTGMTQTLTADRFTGRIGVQNVEDTPKHQLTTYTASSWSAQLPNARNVVSVNDGLFLHNFLIQLLTPSHLEPLLTAVMVPGTDRMHGAVSGTFRDLFDKYATDIGLAALQSRSGYVRIYTTAERKTAAAAALADFYPLTRSQVLSPSSWTQPSEIVADNMAAVYTNSAGNPVKVTANTGAPATSPEQELDWTHIRFSSTQWKHVTTLELRQSTSRYQLPSVTVDLLALLASNNPYDRRQAGQLLALTPGSPITLSGDWHPDIEGVHFATGIDERLDMNTWELTISLTPYLHIIGEPSPPVQPRTWDSARRPWDSDTRTWEDAA